MARYSFGASFDALCTTRKAGNAVAELAHWDWTFRTPSLGLDSLLATGMLGYSPLVRLPNADRASIEDSKVRDYLLSPTHPVGRFKSVFFGALGFSVDQWELLRDALLDLARVTDATPGQPSPFGLKFEIRATLQGPSGRQAELVTVWMVSNGQDFPHFITAYPG